jgi:competence protein ComEA
MDETVGPWRALEDATAEAEAVAGEGPRSRPSIQVVATILASVTLIVVAFWVATSSNGGSVQVEGASPGDDPGPSSQLAAQDPSGSRGGDLVADVQGAVVRPGIVRLPARSRVGDAITAAGGFGPRVAADRVGRELNMAALVRDGDKIVVPSRDDAAAGSGPIPAAARSQPPGPLDLNRATAAELDALPGIGPVTANKIIAARDERPFASVDDLRTRKILGPATFEKLKDLLTVR